MIGETDYEAMMSLPLDNNLHYEDGEVRDIEVSPRIFTVERYKGDVSPSDAQLRLLLLMR